MAYRPPVAVYDACVLYPFQLRNLLMQCAVDRLVEARWSDEIHDEWIRNLIANEPRLSPERLLATRDLMNQVLPAATVVNYAHHIPGIKLRDPNDRHVVAAGVEAGAATIVTWNLRDFAVAELRRLGLTRQTPDAFLMGLYTVAPDATVAATSNARANLRTSLVSGPDFVEALRRQKLSRFAAAMTAHLADI